MYIFEINLLSVALFAIISLLLFSEGCLFTFLIVYFVVQKLLSFIMSHLFIFAFVSKDPITLWQIDGGKCGNSIRFHLGLQNQCGQ